MYQQLKQWQQKLSAKSSVKYRRPKFKQSVETNISVKIFSNQITWTIQIIASALIPLQQTRADEYICLADLCLYCENNGYLLSHDYPALGDQMQSDAGPQHLYSSFLSFF